MDIRAVGKSKAMTASDLDLIIRAAERARLYPRIYQTWNVETVKLVPYEELSFSEKNDTDPVIDANLFIQSLREEREKMEK